MGHKDTSQREEQRVGTITNDLSRLRGEIDASRMARSVFMKTMRTALEGLQDSLGGMLRDFRTARAKMVRRTAADRRAFMSDVQDKVQGLRKEVADLRHMAAADLKGARVAFFGHPGARRVTTARKPAGGSKKVKR